MVLAALADRCIPKDEPIDLLNVAFQQQVKSPNKPAKTKQKKWHQSVNPQELQYTYEVPDRITGRNGLTELQHISPNRQWNFVEINVTLEELKAMRAERVSDLVYPLQSVLDDSIGCAIWFAARGEGYLMTKDQDHLVTTEQNLLVTRGQNCRSPATGVTMQRPNREVLDHQVASPVELIKPSDSKECADQMTSVVLTDHRGPVHQMIMTMPLMK
ncbi:asparagine synthetase domain-containing protein 1-like [Amphiura filiformis]|uniref:asparagine synthetase domain-containing protein 1-like n=1 Tax=Amphiura filiformis TaxID=82378 RepID=UPI003B215A16